MTNNKIDGSRLRELREARQWTQEQVVQVSGVPLRTLQRAESGESVGFETLKALAAAFKTDADNLVLKEVPSAPPFPPDHELVFLPRLTTAGQLKELAGCFGYVPFNDDPATSDETEAIGCFLDTLRDSGNVWSEMSPSAQLQAAQWFKDELTRLEELGFWVFGKVRPSDIQLPVGEPVRGAVAHVAVIRSSNPVIVMKEGAEESAILPVSLPRRVSVAN